jgi:hypothetical protein
LHVLAEKTSGAGVHRAAAARSVRLGRSPHGHKNIIVARFGLLTPRRLFRTFLTG